MVRCLQSHSGDEGMEGRCRDELLMQARKANSDIGMNPLMKSACKEDLESTCPPPAVGKAQIIRMSELSLGADRISCLKSHRYECME